MSRMKRKQIYIEPEQDSLLKRLASRRNITEAELIRGGINQLLMSGPQPPRNIDAWHREKASIKALRKQAPLKGRRRCGREDLYDR